MGKHSLESEPFSKAFLIGDIAEVLALHQGGETCQGNYYCSCTKYDKNGKWVAYGYRPSFDWPDELLQHQAKEIAEYLMQYHPIG